MRELKIPPAALKDEARLQPVLAAHQFRDVEELYAAIGVGERLAALVARHFLAADENPHEAGGMAPLAIEGTEGLEIGEPTSELQSLMRTSYAVFCLKNKKQNNKHYQ